MTYYCTYCLSQIDETTGVCPCCGATNTIPAEICPEQKKKKFPVITIAIVATVLVVASAALLLGALNGMFAPKARNGDLSSTGWQNNDGSYHLYNDEYKISIFDVDGVPAFINNEAEVDFIISGAEVQYSKKGKCDKDQIILMNDLISMSQFYEELGFEGFGQLHAAVNDPYDNGSNARDGGCFEEGVFKAIVMLESNYDFSEKDSFAHEYTHAVTRSIVRWTGQTRAIREAYSDIIGLMYEYEYNSESSSSANVTEPWSL